MTTSRRRRATAPTILRAAVGVAMTSAAGIGGAGLSVLKIPRLSTYRISDSTKPGLIKVTEMPCSASSWPSESARARTANLLIE
jgi:hypothetical protein